METVLITGASGLIGKHLSTFLKKRGYNVIHLNRYAAENNNYKTFIWNVSKGTIDDDAVANADYIINLAGAGIADKRWSKERKEEIINSRTKSIQLLAESIHRNKNKIKAFISVSAIGFYGAITSDKIFNEDDLHGNDFLGNTCYLWENETKLIESHDIRTVIFRLGVVLSDDGGALEKMIPAVRLGFGSPLASGRQFMPWIHIDDLCELFVMAIEEKKMSGTYNAVAAEHTTNKDFMKTIAEILHKPFFFPNVPEFILKLLFGEMAQMLLNGNRVSSHKIENTGFKFKFRKLKDALENLLAK
ncbi:MAG: hypothetical protein K0S44_3226 [Bacteroidetes bacterium]|jgi:uncharacterized protein (TIGR01777 family)|nr:hypothetical protein [Bacteroidota bacterium]